MEVFNHDIGAIPVAIPERRPLIGPTESRCLCAGDLLCHATSLRLQVTSTSPQAWCKSCSRQAWKSVRLRVVAEDPGAGDAEYGHGSAVCCVIEIYRRTEPPMTYE
ncbi:hypothetical protein LIA77_10517 [Sarocladium implicatum]|nr:hypothetical protein LIA77_10517 [Sarocladium implicatum]